MTTELARRRPSRRPSSCLARSTVRATAVLLVALATLFATSASAQDVSISLGEGTTLTERAVQLIGLITVLSLAPSILVMVTSFTRIVVVLSLLRTAIGLQTAPPNAVMVSLALFLTSFIMLPTFQQAYDEGVVPVINGDMELMEGFTVASEPFRQFMLKQVREEDLQLFVDLSNAPAPDTPEDLSLRILIPAFMISELRRAFEIGFLIYLPFVIIDMVVASILMAMGMMMLPPVIISLPFKLIFFVLVDGWQLIAGSLVRSFNG
ncbi:Flagellar biosynthetic protein FliP precursor [Hartmannibacter diazotrophicus]|uniref:Flagellar biosynthetic protein FliP n=1 Tax=Hartmannibacter diazotrophicus TaxID=1482074 RepID=A0A2C9D7U3_9HYPH|nr:flagellar type III secretion system pore protein FliP [Hartmannibacter diazotrophicus]SON56208.1 Flagellar biosynthetic protein FliP precursor [Hartmannibacter diazotrophicus]